MSKHQADANDNHWPGYVDALTTMLMVLTFVMMILGMAVFVSSQNVSRLIIERIAKAAKIELPSADTPVDQVAEQLVTRLEADAEAQAGRRRAAAGDASAPDARLDETIRLRSSEPAHKPGDPAPARALQRGAGLVIEFQPRATRLDEATARILSERLESEPGWRQAERVDIRASVDREGGAVTDARRIAYYRAMQVRSALIRAGTPAARIRLTVDEDQVGPGAQVVRVLAMQAGAAPTAEPAQAPAPAAP